MHLLAKRIALLLSLVIALSLLGCAEQSYETVIAITDWEDENSWVLTKYLKDGVISNEGYYYLYDGILYFADTSNGIAVCLCSKPGCLHEKGTPQEQEDCDANLLGEDMPMFFWNDFLFYVQRDLYGTHVYRRNADGTAQTIVADLGTRYTKEGKNVDLYYSAHLGDCFYYTTLVQSPVKNDEGETSIVDMTYIGCLNLKTNKESILLQVEHESLRLVAVCPEGLLFSYFEDAGIDYLDENFREQLNEAASYVKFLNFETGDVTTVLDGRQQDIGWVSFVHGSKLYYARDGRSREYDMLTGNERIVSSGKPIDGRFGLQQTGGISMLYYIPTGEILPTAFAGERLSVEAVSADAAILARNIFVDGKATSATYCYVKLADLADGLQKEDTLDLYTYYYRKSATSYEEMVDQWEEMYG